MTLHSDIDKVFKNGLNDYSQKAPAFVWDNIEQSLNRRRLKKRRNILYGVAASVALLLSFSAGYFFPDTATTQMAVATQQPAEQPEQVIPTQPAVAQPVVNSNNSNNNLKSNVKATTLPNTSTQPAVADSTPAEAPTNVKKAVSSGVLLPPMYAGQDTYSQPNTVAVYHAIQPNKNTETIDASIDSTLVASDNNLSESSSMAMVNQPDPIATDYYYYEPQDEPTKGQSVWSVGVSASPLISYRDVYDVSEQSVSTSNNTSSLEKQYENEKALVSYSAGVNVNYELSNRWNLQSGLYFSEMGIESQNIDIYTKGSATISPTTLYSINTSVGNVVIKGSPNDLIQILKNQNEQKAQGSEVPVDLNGSSTPDLQISLVQTYEYYELPLVVNYKAIDRKFDLNLSGGLSANFMYGNNVYVENDGKRYNLDAEVENINTMSYSGIVSIGMEYPIVDRLHFNLNPTLRYSLTPLNDAGTVYPYSFGVYTGLKYNF